jgi:predicted phage baseplate assembly protein
MPLPLPRLADRDFDQLVDEARNTLPLNAPAWTDHNASDPGITLLELFAYLTEIDLYRLDRISPAQYRTFLRLLGYPIRTAQVARTVLVFQQSTADVIPLAPRVHVTSTDGGVVFQTTASLDVVRAKVVSVLTSSAGALIDHINDQLYAPLGNQPVPGDALYLGFDRPLGPAGTRVRLYAFGEDAARDGETWRALAAEARRARRDVRATCPGGALRGVGRYWQHYSARLTWEYHDSSGRWRPLSHAKDRTRGLSISGPVHFRSPKPQAHVPGGVTGYNNSYFIRCRLQSGGYDCAPTVRSVRINAVGARHAADVPPEAITTNVRRANQAYHVTQAPVVPRSTRVDVTLKDGTHEQWTEAADWDRSGPFDRHYVLEPETGTLRFGDGRQGLVMLDSSAIKSILVTYRVGGGVAGNVGAGTLTKTLATGAGAAAAPSQPAAAYGGAAAETLAAAEGRAVRGLAEERSAVTLADFERMALSVPGVPVVRTHAIGGFHPTLSCLPAAGCVTVVIVPACVDRQRNPSPDLCAEVERYLDRRRPVACELHVVGPQYTTVSVTARLHLTPGANAASAKEAARDALKRFFHPLSGGPANNGWPVGRGVYRSEVLALLASIPGVAYVTNLALQRDAGIAADCGNVDICAHGLVVSGMHEIRVDAGNHAGHL